MPEGNQRTSTSRGLPLSAPGSQPEWLVGGGEMGERIRSTDWSTGPLGPRGWWSFSLRTALTIVLESPVPMALVWGRELVLLYNDAYREIAGDERGEALGRSVREALPGLSVISASALAVIARGESGQLQNERSPVVRGGCREDAYFNVCYSPVRGDDGAIAGCLVTCFETTQGVRDREALRAERDRAAAEARLEREELGRALAEAEAGKRLLDALMENIPIGITIADAPDVKIRAVSRYGRELTGRPPEKIEGIPVDQHAAVWGILRADGTPACNEDLPLTRATQRGEHVSGEEWILVRPDGVRVPILCTAGPIRDNDGEVVGGVIGWQDITDRKRFEARLRESEERLRLVIDTTDIGAFDFYPQTGRLEWSMQAKRHFGLPADANVDFETFLRGLHPDDRERVQGMVKNVLRPESGGEYRTEYRTIGIEDGKERWLSARGHVTFDASGSPMRFFGMTLDITERKRAENALVEADRRKNEFLAVLSHELRNPLGPIRNSVYILEHAASGGEQAKRAVRVIDRQSQHIAKLVDDLLDVTRISRGKIQLRHERLDLNALACATAEDHRSMFVAAGVDLAVQGTGKPLWVEGDPTRLAQMIGNLLNNAAKFTQRGGQAILTVEADAEEHVTVRVRDNGAGMSAEQSLRVFEPFMQAPQTMERASGGLGLGLALVKSLTEIHGGTVSAQSEGLGKGSEFTITLPLAPSRLERRPAAEFSAEESKEPRRVLIVEDDEVAAESLKEAIELTNHEVLVACSGKKAMEMVQHYKPHVVLCDIGLPGFSGYDVARALRADPDPEIRSTYLVALSGYAGPEHVVESKDAGFDRHLAKPASIADLDRLVREAPNARAERG